MGVIGVDLGITNSVGAFYDQNKEQVIITCSTPNGLLPSVVARDCEGQILVGEAAVWIAPSDPANAIFSIKRLLGRAYSNPQVASVRKRVSYAMVPSDGDSGVKVVLGGRPYSPVDISAMILRRIKEDAERQLGEPVTHAVMTVPAYFEVQQRMAIREAGEQAGLIVKDLVFGPIAAGIAYERTLGDGKPKRVLVYQMGGGTFDVSTLMITDGTVVLADTRGDNWLGGDDFDRAIVAEITTKIAHDYAFDPGADGVFALRAKQLSEKVKVELTNVSQAEIVMPMACVLPNGSFVDIGFTLTRQRFDQLIQKQVDRTMEVVRQALEEQKLECDQIDTVLLVGGSTLVPLVYETVAGFFGAEKVVRGDRPLVLEAHGAAILAAQYADHQGVWSPEATARSADTTLEALEEERMAGDLKFAIGAAEYFLRTYHPYMEEHQRRGLERMLEEARQELARGTRYMKVIFDAVIAGMSESGLASILYVGERIAFGASPERARMIYKCIQDAQAAYISHDERKLKEQVTTLRALMDAELEARSEQRSQFARDHGVAAYASPESFRGPGRQSRADAVKKSDFVTDTVPPAIQIDNVHFTLTGQSVLVPGESHELLFWAHVAKQKSVVLAESSAALGVAVSEISVKSEGPFPLQRGSRLSVRLKISGVKCLDSHKWITWTGEIGRTTFLVQVPSATQQGTHSGRASIRLDGCEVARMSFSVYVGSSKVELAEIPSRTTTYRKAFASYASEDRVEVLARIQGMEAAYKGLDVFVDVMHLRAAQSWERELEQHISGSDVFYLFWCRHARKSEWVDKEWHWALRARGEDFIDPVPLETPDLAPPPPELGSKHFNDPLLAFIAASGGRHASS